MILHKRDNLSLQTKLYVDREGTLDDGLAICQHTKGSGGSNWVIASFDYRTNGWELVECADRLTDINFDWENFGMFVRLGHAILEHVIPESELPY